jgi:peptidoglycan/xylan/chitin deacetylase (PgdA/CDA1 family)
MAAQSERSSEPAHTPVAMDSESPRPASRVIKFAISLAFYAVSEVWRFVLKIAGRPLPPSAVVIYYHHVLAKDRARFSRQLDDLVRWTKPLAADHGQPLAAGSRYSIVTVDDGWKSFADNAVPELELRHIPVTMFAISDRLGESVDGISFDRLVTAEELRRLKSPIVTIGSHTATHAKMTELDGEHAVRELRESRERLTELLAQDVGMFCFPYGAYNETLVASCRDAGYERVFTCMPKPANPHEFVIGRVRVDPTDWPLEFHLKLMGAYRWLPMAISLKREILMVIRERTRGPDRSSRIPTA